MYKKGPVPSKLGYVGDPRAQECGEVEDESLRGRYDECLVERPTFEPPNQPFHLIATFQAERIVPRRMSRRLTETVVECCSSCRIAARGRCSAWSFESPRRGMTL